jgi:hypothetical protein
MFLLWLCRIRDGATFSCRVTRVSAISLCPLPKLLLAQDQEMVKDSCLVGHKGQQDHSRKKGSILLSLSTWDCSDRTVLNI